MMSSVLTMLSRSTLIALLGLCTLNTAAATAIMITESTYIGPDDTSLHDAEVIVDGAELTIDGTHSIHRIELLNGAVLTHSVEAEVPPHLILNSMHVDAASQIDVSGKGQMRPAGYSDTSVAGSYGGWGGVVDGGVTNPPFGSLREPNDYGVAGALSTLRGGGIVRLDVATLELDGEILANGEDATSVSGSPSGGSIWLDVGSLSGQGAIKARGGERSNSSIFYGGGGGRVAIYYDQVDGFDLASQISARGGLSGASRESGGAGTVYLRDKAESLGLVRIDNGQFDSSAAFGEISESLSDPVEITNAHVELVGDIALSTLVATNSVIHHAGDVVIDSLDLTDVHWSHTGDLTVTHLDHDGGSWYHSGLLQVTGSYTVSSVEVTHDGPYDIVGIDDDYTVPPGSTVRVNHPESWRNVIVDGGTLVINYPQSWASLQVHNGGLVTHDAPSDNSNNRLELTLDTLVVDSSSRIDVSGKGQGRLEGHTDWNVAGSYGGWGGTADGQVTNPPFGSLREPNDYGVAGALSDLRGGGIVRLDVATLELEGEILANGEDGTLRQGSPSGGSIWLDVGSLSGQGAIKARGGERSNSSIFYGGGGGRVAIYYDQVDGFDLASQISARGGLSGASRESGGAGTVYLRDKAESLGLVRIDNGQFDSSAAFGEISESLSEPVEITNAHVELVGDIALSTLVATNSVIHHAGDVVIDSLDLTDVHWSHTGDLTVTHLDHDGGSWYHSGLLQVTGSYTVSSVEVTHDGPYDIVGIDDDYTVPPGSTVRVNHPESWRNVIVDGGTLVINYPQSWASLQVHNGGLVTHDAPSDNSNNRLELTLDTLVVDSSSRIDVSGKGQGRLEGHTDWNVAGSYGGWGGTADGQVTNPPFGSLREPNDYGVAGALSDLRGGGIVRLDVATLELEGEILANGEDATSVSGSPSGGSIWLEVGTLSGQGAIKARGGERSNSSIFYGGGGGRIAIYYDQVDGFDLTSQISARGGLSSASRESGGAGTVYLRDKAESLGLVRIDNGQFDSSAAFGEISESLSEPVEITNAHVELVGDIALSTLVATNSVIHHAGDVVIDSLDLTDVHWSHTGDLTVTHLDHDGGSWYHSGLLQVTGSYTVSSVEVTHDGPYDIVGIDDDYTVPPGSTVRVNHPESWRNVIVDGGTLVINYPQSWASLQVHNGGLVTHDAPSDNSNNRLELTLDTLVVDSSSRIDVSGKGQGRLEGHTDWNVAGSYGGWGGTADGQVTNPPFGSLREPNDYGVAGALSDLRGGGIVRLDVATLELEGEILANGEDATSVSGSPSGGSIWLEVGTLSGQGAIKARGGERSNSSIFYGGGGGRIAIYYDQVDGFDLTSQISARGGLSSASRESGGAGTVYLRDKAESLGLVRIDNGQFDSSAAFHEISESLQEPVVIANAHVEINAVVELDTLTTSNSMIQQRQLISVGSLSMEDSEWYQHAAIDGIGGQLHLSHSTLVPYADQTWGLIEIDDGGLITHPIEDQQGVQLTADRIIIRPGGGVDVSGRGRTALEGTSGRHGGSHGGLGGEYNDAVTNPIYGDAELPIELGAGGSSSRGGGRISLVANELIVDGEIAARGASLSSNSVGLGAGGSILIDTGLLAGSGVIDAAGGSATSFSAGGGGGRIAVYYGAALDHILDSITAAGGQVSSGAQGEDGTIFLSQVVAVPRVTSLLPDRAVNAPTTEFLVHFSQPVNADSFTQDDVLVEGPAGAVAVQHVAMIEPARWRIVVADALAQEGDYQITIGPDIQSTHGLWMDQDEGGDGSLPGAAFSGVLTLDLTPPAAPQLSSHPTSPEVNTTFGEQSLLAGKREAATGILINGELRVQPGSEDWLAMLDLPPGYSQWDIQAVDAAGNLSEVVTVIFFRPDGMPAVTGMVPTAGSCLASPPADVGLYVYEPESGFDLASSTRQLERNEVTVAGVWEESDAIHRFYPDQPLTDGEYRMFAQLVDNSGQISEPFEGHFIVDSVAPPAPVVDDYPPESTIISVTLTGSKEAATGIWINGQPATAIDDSTSWSHTVTLLPGANEFLLEARDCAGNASVPVIVEIDYDSTPPGPVSVSLQQGGDGRSVLLDWSDYDELENGGDIDFYTIYVADQPFVHVSEAQIVGNTPAGTQAFVAEGLEPFKTWYFAVVATDLSGSYLAEVSSVGIELEDHVPPEDVTGLVALDSQETSVSLGWVPSADSAGDLAGYRVYIDDVLYADDLPGDVEALTIDELQPASGYLVRVTAFDDVGNESAGVEQLIATLLEHPDPVGAEPAHQGASVTWAPGAPAELVEAYRVYVDTEPFASIEGREPAASVSAATTGTLIEGLVNDQTYFVAVTTVNISGGERPAVSTTEVTPQNLQAPEDVTNLSVVSGADELELNWTPSVDSQGDLAGYRVYVDDQPLVELDGQSSTLLIGDLEPATAYELRVTAFDIAGNESPGRSITGVTWLDNPPTLTATAMDSRIALSWSAVQPQQLIDRYAVYLAPSTFNDVSGMAPVALRDADQPHATISDLVNNQTYYVAVTVRNLSGGENPAVSPIAVQPSADTEGPEIIELLYRGEPLQSGSVLTRSGEITLTAQDESGVAQVGFASMGALNVVDASGGSQFGTWWSLEDETDGANALTITATDTVGNVTELTISVEVALAPPPAPEITQPANGTQTNQASLAVAGTATNASEVRVMRNGEAASDWVVTGADASFSASLTLVEGSNTLTAVARNNRGLAGPESVPVEVTLDTDAPDAPTGVSATAREAGVIRLRWLSVTGDGLGYHVYRSTEPFESTAQAVRVNSNPLTELQFDDATPVDGRYYYRVLAESAVGNPSLMSAMVDAVADREPPRALEITYDPEGAYDPVDNRFGPGHVSVTVHVSEPLLTTPFLSMTPEGGVPMAVGLFQTDELVYQGSFEILDTTVSATAWAVFSARDLAGNRGTEVDTGESIQIDTNGPDVQAMTISPTAPIHNTGSVTVAVELELTEPVTSGDPPRLDYNLSANPDVWLEVEAISQIDPLNWSAEFPLPAVAGQFEAETLTLRWQAEDDLGNVGNRILSPYRFQVYQGDLPPLDPPGMLDAQALPGGQVGLMWPEVVDAAAYEVWRRDPGSNDFLPVARVFELEHVDQTPADDDYAYTVVSVRQANGQESISGLGPVRQVTSDSIPPEPPTDLELHLTSSGIVAQWVAPEPVWPGDDELVYNLYRSSELEIVDVDGLEPVVTGTHQLFALDADPMNGEHTYAVTAVDAAGNESAPSASEYLNFDLLPVSSLRIERFGNAAPQISWTHSATTLAGFNIYAHHPTGGFRLNNELIKAHQHIDVGYYAGERDYEVIAVDANGQESLGRKLLLPDVTFEPLPDARLRRGLINGLEFVVHNRSSRPLQGVSVRLDLDDVEHRSQPFSLEAGEEDIVRVPVPGYLELPDTVAASMYLEYRPIPSEAVVLGRSIELPVDSSGMVVTLMTDTFTRGGAGRVRARIENPGDEPVEVVTARGNGNHPSPDMRIKLLDSQHHVLNVRAVQQYVGDDVVTLPNGYTIARIPAGGSWTSQWQEIIVPGSAPDQVRVELDIDHFYFAFGEQERELRLTGLSASRHTTLVDTSYYGELIEISPEQSYGTEPILIRGRAVERATGAPMRDVALNLVLGSSGFEREIAVMADDDGEFVHLFEPLPTESGIYEVSAVHPEILDRPVQGTFTLERLSIRPARYELHHPYDRPWAIPIEVRAGVGTEASNVRFEYLAEDQLDGVLIPGLMVDTASSIAHIEPGERRTLAVELEAGPTTSETGTLYLRLTSDEAGGDPLAVLAVNFRFTSADPVLRPEPRLLNFGLAQGEVRSRSVRIANMGFADAEGVNFSLADIDGQPAPEWIQIGLDDTPRTIGVGDHVDVPITVSPPSDLPSQSAVHQLVVSADNHPTSGLALNVAVTQSGTGSALFHVRNMYTATLDENGQVIEGLTGARVRLQDEMVLSNVHEGITDSNGELLFEDIPAGRYLFRISAANHETATGRVTIQPETTAFESAFLSYNLVQVEWSVTETTIEDVYEITLTALFETNVPAAVLVADPPHRPIPDMQAGDVFVTQFALTNHGLIRATDVVMELPPEDSFFRYELLDEIPPVLEAQQTVVVPYRMIAKQDFPPTDGGAGGCFSYFAQFSCPYGYQCPDGTFQSSRASHFLSKVLGSSCRRNPSGGGGGSGGGDAVIVGPWGPIYNIDRGLGGSTCAPDCEGEECCFAGGGGGSE
jgi:large repetitive protein